MDRLMFIVAGRQKTRKKMGYVAEFCPVCRDITPCEAGVIGTGDHLFGVSLGHAKVLYHDVVCLGCGIRQGVDGTLYSAFARGPGKDVGELMRLTFPRLHSVRGARLDLEDQVRRGTILREDRQRLLDESFELFSHLTTRHFGENIQLGGRGGWGCVTTFAVSAAVLVGGGAVLVEPALRRQLPVAAGCVFAVGAVLTLVQMAKEPDRLFRRNILPQLVRTLKPLAPTREEIEDRLRLLKLGRAKLGRKVEPDELISLLEQAGAAV